MQNLTSETQKDLENYIETGEDAICLLGNKDIKNRDVIKVVTRFQTTAEPSLVGKMLTKNSNIEIMQGIPMYNQAGYSSFAVRDKSLVLRFPLYASKFSTKPLFASKEERICPNFKEVINVLEHSFNCKVVDDANISRILKIEKSMFGKKTIYLKGNIEGHKVAETDKLCQLFHLIAKNLVVDSFKGTTNPDRVQFATSILTTLFIAQSFDLEDNYNQKVQSALKLQLSNTLSAISNVGSSTLDLISENAEVAIQKFLKKTNKSYEDIVNNQQKMGYTYKYYPTSLNEALYGQKTYAPIVSLYQETKKPQTEQEVPHIKLFTGAKNFQPKTNECIIDSGDYVISELHESETDVKNKPDSGNVKKFAGLLEPIKVQEIVRLPINAVTEQPDKKFSQKLLLTGEIESEHFVEIPDEVCEQIVTLLDPQQKLDGLTKNEKGRFTKTNKIISEETLKRKLRKEYNKHVIEALNNEIAELKITLKGKRGEDRKKIKALGHQVCHARDCFEKISKEKQTKNFAEADENVAIAQQYLVVPLQRARAVFVEVVARVYEHQKAKGKILTEEQINKLKERLINSKKMGISSIIQNFASSADASVEKAE